MRFADPTKLRGNYEYIFPLDDAFDSERDGFKEAYKEWADTADQAKLAPFLREDGNPAVFTLRHLTAKERRICLGVAQSKGYALGCYEACRLALVAITAGGGSPEVPREMVNGREMVTDAFMEVLEAVNRALIGSIGTVALERVNVPKK